MYLRRISYWIAVLAICAGLAGCAGRHDIMLADFEGVDFGDWVVTGECFGTGPAHGPLGDQAEVKGFEGKRFLNTYHGGNRAEGIMTSPEFVIERDYLNFLIGGGDTGETSFELLIDGKIARSTTGRNEETLRWRSWDVKSFRGEKVRIRIVDTKSGDNPLKDISGELLEIQAVIEPAGAKEVGFRIRGIDVFYNVKRQKIYCLGEDGPLTAD